MENQLTHIGKQGRAKMVDVSAKAETNRTAIARGWIAMRPETLKLITDKEITKGDVLAVAQVAGIMAAKRTPDLIPMCHPLLLSGIDIDFRFDYENSKIEIESTVNLSGATGVEMEALTAVSAAALTIYDMCKAVDRAMVIGDIRLILKDGGKSGRFVREGEQLWLK